MTRSACALSRRSRGRSVRVADTSAWARNSNCLKGGQAVKGSTALRSVAVGIGSEDFHETALVAQFLDSAGDLGIIGMTFDVNVEKIFPCLAAAGSAFDLGHVQLMGAEGA